MFELTLEEEMFYKAYCLGRHNEKISARLNILRDKMFKNSQVKYMRQMKNNNHTK